MTSLILLPKSILRTVQAERKRRLPKETGGFLIGIRRGPHIEVTGMTDQGAGDVATYTSFERNCQSHRERIHAAWKRSGGIESLIGDWHSHPVGTADASSIDQSAWRTLVRTSQRAIIGLVDAGGAFPILYFATKCQRSCAIKLTVELEDEDHFVFSVPIGST